MFKNLGKLKYLITENKGLLKHFNVFFNVNSFFKLTGTTVTFEEGLSVVPPIYRY
jgi:hypothetical protein